VTTEKLMYSTYFDAVEDILRRVRDTNHDGILEAAARITDTVAADGIVHLYGSGHSQLAAMELADRAGVLVPMEVIFDPAYGRAEAVEGYVSTLLRDYELRPSDSLVVISTSGRNPAPIEMAMAGRDRGLSTIAVTARLFSRSFPSRHSSGLRLMDVADIVLDTCSTVGDAAVTIEGLPVAVGPTSTIAAVAILHAVVVEAVGGLLRRGLQPPVYASQNVDGAERHNDPLIARYRGRIRTLP
jgi:uncharacterized phosphosugar-binding protein